MDRPLLALSLLLGVACQVPSTLGLPCEQHPQCDPGQFCMAGKCAMGMPPPPTTGSTTSGPSSTTSGSGGGNETVADTSSVDGTTVAISSTTSGSSTGTACGIGSCYDLDVLVVLDNSPSMMQWLLPLANSLDDITKVVGEALDQMCTFHIGITSSNQYPLDNPPDCQFPGALLYRSAMCGGGDNVRPWWNEEDGSTSDVLDQVRCLLVAEGTGGSQDEMMLAALLGALDPANNDGACNQSFRRPEAKLLVLYVSDEDDPTPSDMLDNLAADFQMWEDPNNIAFVSVVADNNTECPWDPTGNDSDGSGAMVPSALNGFLALAGIPFDQRLSVDICQQPTGSYMIDGALDLLMAACGS